ncbi:MAG: GntR family transcriptional regulator [Pseudomonadales bacterium]
MNNTSDTSFSDVFSSLYTGRDSSDRVLKTIIEGLLDKRYKPGQRVVAAQLAEELGVSIVPVREAIHLLVGEGVIELTAGKGARIRSMDLDEVVNLWRIVSCLAKLGAGFAARNINHREDSVIRINTAMKLITDSAGRLSGFDFLMVLMRYHIVVNEVAEIPKLDEAIRRMGFFFWAIFFAEYIPVREYGEMYIRNHQRVTDAIVNGDESATEAAYQYHIDWTSALLLGARPDPGQPWVRGSS